MTTTTSTSTKNHTESRWEPNVGAQYNFAALNEPGAYIINWSGQLLRLPEDALKAGHSPVFEILGTESTFVTKLSDNPYLPVSKARMVAADLDIHVNF